MNLFKAEQRLVREAITEKFGARTVMQCKKLNPDSAYSVWYANVNSLKAKTDQLLVLVVPLTVQHQIGSEQTLAHLPWQALHTRTTKDDKLLQELMVQNIPLFTTYLEQTKEILRCKFARQAVMANSSLYLSQALPSLRVDLLHDTDNTTWAEVGTLESCLETYQCKIEFQ